ncbi:MAG: hypothetical protein GX352_02770 [Clostridiales bacterium]|nr:hypothetical protein [Clostridiales bacterium]
MRGVIGSSLVDDVLTDGRIQITNDIRDNLVKLADRYGLGVSIVNVNLQDVDLPTLEVSEVFKAVTEAGLGDIIYSNIRIELGKLGYGEIINHTVKSRGDADKEEAAKLYNESYGKDTDFFNLYTTLESYRTMINDETVIMFPADSPYAKYIFGD